MPDEILSQAEIDALLSSVIAEKKEDEWKATKEPFLKKEGIGKRAPRVYDFASPDRFSKEHIRTLELIHENSTRILNSILSPYLRTIIQINLVGVVETSYEDFLRALPNPTVMGVFSMAPLEGNALLEINPRVVFFFYERLLGGSAEMREEKEEEEESRKRELTDIEQSVAEGVFIRMLNGLKEAWSSLVQFTPRLERIETNPAFSQIVSPKDRVAHVTYEIKIGEGKSAINLCLPYVVLEPITQKLSPQYVFTQSYRREREEDAYKIRKKLESILIPLVVELGETIINVKELLDLQVGDVIKLNNTVNDRLKVKIGEKTKFFSQPGIAHGRVAVQITAKVEEEIGGE